ncbi:MAG: DedA family protein [Candidatus Cloacimonetes bacterium]|jgi:membrane-associated protein|nr:DedA family protein [Candidatus Cloacimonadota bacterium]
MEWILALVDFILNIDVHLDEIIRQYGGWTYMILFAIIFAETGFVVTPFLPGDSLLFAAGAFAARGSLDPYTLSVLLIIAAIMGDTVNYWIGHALAPGLANGRIRFIKQRHLEKTQAFYDKHGGKTIIIARFVPIVRTFAPFVAGVGAMHYPRFLAYNVIGGFVWVLLFVWAGFFFGNIPAVEHNFTLVIFAIIFISLLPPIIEFIRSRRSTA